MDNLLSKFMKFLSDLVIRKDKTINALQELYDGVKAENDGLRRDADVRNEQLKQFGAAVDSAIAQYTPPEEVLQAAEENDANNPTQTADELIDYVAQQEGTETNAEEIPSIGSEDATPPETLSEALEDLAASAE